MTKYIVLRQESIRALTDNALASSDVAGVDEVEHVEAWVEIDRAEATGAAEAIRATIDRQEIMDGGLFAAVPEYNWTSMAAAIETQPRIKLTVDVPEPQSLKA